MAASNAALWSWFALDWTSLERFTVVASVSARAALVAKRASLLRISVSIWSRASIYQTVHALAGGEGGVGHVGSG